MATYRTVEPAGVTEGMNGSVERQALLLGRRPFLIKNLARLSLENLRAHISASTTSVETRLVLSPSGLSFGEKRRSSMKSPSSSSLAEPVLPYRMTDLTLVNNVFQMTDMPTVLVCVIQLEDKGEHFYEIVVFRLRSYDDVALFTRTYAAFTQSPPNSSLHSRAPINSDDLRDSQNTRQNGHSTSAEKSAMNGRNFAKTRHPHTDQTTVKGPDREQVSYNTNTNITERDRNLLNVPVKKSRSVLFQSPADDSLLKSDDSRRHLSHQEVRSPTLMRTGDFNKRSTQGSGNDENGGAEFRLTQKSDLPRSALMNNTHKGADVNNGEYEIQLRNVGTMTPSLTPDRGSHSKRKLHWEPPCDYELFCHRAKVYMSDGVGMADVICQTIILSSSVHESVTSQSNDIDIYPSVDRRPDNQARSYISDNGNRTRNKSGNSYRQVNGKTHELESQGSSSVHKTHHEEDGNDYLDGLVGRVINDNEYRIETFLRPEINSSTSGKGIFTEYGFSNEHSSEIHKSERTLPYVQGIVDLSDLDLGSASDIAYNSLPRRLRREDGGWDSTSLDTLVEDKPTGSGILAAVPRYAKKSSVKKSSLINGGHGSGSTDTILKKSVKIDPASLNPTKVKIHPSSMHLISHDDAFNKNSDSGGWNSDDQVIKFRRKSHLNSSSGKDSRSSIKFNDSHESPTVRKGGSNINRDDQSSFSRDDYRAFKMRRSQSQQFEKMADEHERGGRRTPTHVIESKESFIKPLSSKENRSRFPASNRPQEAPRKTFTLEDLIQDQEHIRREGRSRPKLKTSVDELDHGDPSSKTRRSVISPDVYRHVDVRPTASIKRSGSLDHERSDRSIVSYLPMQDLQIRDTGLIKKIELGRRRLFPNAPDKVSLKGRIFGSTADKQRVNMAADPLSRDPSSRDLQSRDPMSRDSKWYNHIRETKPKKKKVPTATLR